MSAKRSQRGKNVPTCANRTRVAMRLPVLQSAPVITLSSLEPKPSSEPKISLSVHSERNQGKYIRIKKREKVGVKYVLVKSAVKYTYTVEHRSSEISV